MNADPSVTMDADTAVTITADLIDDAARDRLTITGSDAARYLHSQISQEIRDLSVGAARWTFLLNSSGKIDVFARVRRTADKEFVLDTEAGFGTWMETRVRRFLIRVDVATELEAATSSAPDNDHESRRIAAGWPRLGHEIKPGKTIPAMTGVTPIAVNFTKGCYPGQELVERMDSRGAEPPYRLRIVDADGYSVGDILKVDDVEVGVISSVSPVNNLALAMVKRGFAVGCQPAFSSRLR